MEKNINNLFKAGARILGLQDPAGFRPHSLQAVMITTLANNNAVNVSEVMHSAQHNTAATSTTYQQSNSISESNRFHALGVAKPNVMSVKPTDVKILPPQHPCTTTTQNTTPPHHPCTTTTPHTTAVASLTQDKILKVEEKVLQLQSTVLQDIKMSYQHRQIMLLSRKV